jgi:hypothetical protein
LAALSEIDLPTSAAAVITFVVVVRDPQSPRIIAAEGLAPERETCRHVLRADVEAPGWRHRYRTNWVQMALEATFAILESRLEGTGGLKELIPT